MSEKPRSSHFEEDWIIKYLSESLDEGPLVDCKQELWRVGKFSEFDEQNSDQLRARGELIKHVIAMANAAYRRGQHARIIFGITDDGEFFEDEAEGCIGVERQTTRCSKDKMFCPKHSWDDCIKDCNKFRKFQHNNRSDYSTTACSYIKPSLVIDYHYGWIRYRGKEGFVIYLEIHPPSDCSTVVVDVDSKIRKQIEVIRDSDGDFKHIDRGACFERVMDQTRFVQDPSSIVSYKDIPFVGRKIWLKYFSKISIFNKERLPGEYLPSFILTENGEVALGELVKKLLGNQSEFSVALIEGPAGIGKTVGIHESIRGLVDYGIDSLRSDRYDFPRCYIPVYVPLKGVGTLQELKTCVGSWLNYSGVLGLQADQAVKLLNDPQLSFVIFFDGVDEMLRQNVNPLSIIHSFIMENPRCRYFITARSNWLIPQKKDWALEETVYGVWAPLADAQISGELNFINEGYEWLYRIDGSLEELFHIPLYLKVIREQLIDKRCSNLGILLRKISEAIFSHARKSFVDPSNDNRSYRAGLKKLAFTMLSDDLYQLPWERALEIIGTNGEKVIKWSLEVGILKETENNLDILEFSVPILFWYWAAESLHLDKNRRNLILGKVESSNEVKKVLRILANLWEKDITDIEIKPLLMKMPYPFPLIALFERRYFEVQDIICFEDYLVRAVEMRHKIWLDLAFKDRYIPIRIQAFDQLKSYGDVFWEPTLEEFISIWEDELLSNQDQRLGILLEDAKAKLIELQSGFLDVKEGKNE